MRKYLIATVISLLSISSSFAMNKSELIDAIEKDSGLSKADAKRSLDGFVTATSDALKKGDRILDLVNSIFCT